MEFYKFEGIGAIFENSRPFLSYTDRLGWHPMGFLFSLPNVSLLRQCGNCFPLASIVHLDHFERYCNLRG